MSLASAAAFALLHSLWEVALLALLAWLSLSLLRGASAGMRHAVGMVWLVAMAAAPIVTFVLYWHAPLSMDVMHGARADLMLPLLLPLHEPGSGAAMPWADARRGWLLVCVSQLWLLGVALMLIRQIGGWRTMRRIECVSFVALPPEWLERFEALRSALGVSRDVAVRLAERVASPFTAHVLRPVIWLPLTLLTQLPREQIEALLAHELAHIRRLDWCWNAMQCAIEAFLFHHPGMWWLSRRIREEREHACDDLAVSVCGDPIVLAEALAGLQRQRRRAPRLALAAEGGSLMKRVSHLLSIAPARPSLRWPGALLLMLCSGSLLAMQLVPPARLLINLRYEASSEGELTPGNYRQYTASYLGEKRREYRISMDTGGHVDENYAEDGQRKTMDADARQWLKSVTLMNASSEVAKPKLERPSLPEPSLLPELPELPPVPEPPPLPSQSEELKALMAMLQSDPQVTAVTGLPATPDRGSFHGSVHLWGSRDFHLWGVDDPVGGKAAFTVVFKGPKGRVNVAWSGKTVAGAWKADSMKLAALTP
ncbi:MAG TPA: M56 family metallopeptidase [Burkholderiaceae bacterium]